jgi:hypothetical protein
MTKPDPLPDGYERRFIRITSPRAHILDMGYAGISYFAPALCGTLPAPGGWWGTGSQGEHDKAASLPLCQHCIDKLNERRPPTPVD